MQVLLLGPVAVVDRTRVHHLTSTRQATLLAALGSQAGATVSHSRLVDALWGDRPPSTARNTIQVHVSALRRLLGADAIRAEADGYRLDTSPAETDVGRFRELTQEGHELFASGRYAEAGRVLRAALALWRGNPLAGIDSTWADDERDRLAAVRLLATTTRLDADLALGRHLLVLDDLAQLCDEHPYDEDLAARHILALYRSGRQREALTAYDDMRHRLVEELGVDPGPKLQDLHRRVLSHDLSLQAAASVRAAQTPWRIPLSGASPDPLVGREALLQDLESRMAAGQLVTLVGPSGVGKTRVATELARRGQGNRRLGAAVVSGIGLHGVDDLLTRLVGQLDAGRPVDPTSVARLIEEGDLLVVVDDLEPRSAAAVELGNLVASSSSSWLVTAPRPIGLPDEVVVPVPPLETHATDPASGQPGSGVLLLLRRAEAAGARLGDDPETLALAAECAKLLDGIPLALELAAPDAVLGLSDLAGRLRRARAEGQGAVAMSFTTSLDQLDPAERSLLAVLALAGAPADLELLTTIALPDLDAGGVPGAVAALVRDGLVRRSPGAHGYALFDVLDTIAVEAVAKLPAAQLDASARALVHACAEVFTAGQYLPSQLHSVEQGRRWMALDAVGRRAVELAGRAGLVEEAAMMTVALQEQIIEDRDMTPDPRIALALAGTPGISDARRSDLHVIVAAQHGQLGNAEEGAVHFDAALNLATRLGDSRRIAMILAHRGVNVLQGWHDLGDAEELTNAALGHARQCGSPEVLAAVLSLRPASADPCDDQRHGVKLARRHGLVGIELLCLANLADRCLDEGDLAAAERLALEAGALATDLHNPTMAGFMAATLQAARAISGSGRSLAALSEALLSGWRVQDVRAVTDALLKLAAGALHGGEAATAAECLGLFDSVMADGGHQRSGSEIALIETWLRGVQPVAPAVPLGEAIQRVAELFRTGALATSAD